MGHDNKILKIKYLDGVPILKYPNIVAPGASKNSDFNYKSDKHRMTAFFKNIYGGQITCRSCLAEHPSVGKSAFCPN